MIILIILIIVLLLSFNYIKNLFKSDVTKLDDVKLKEEDSNNNGFALMLQKEDGSGYVESSSSTWPIGMVFNSELSGCVDVNGNKIDSALSFNTSTNAVTLRTNKTAYCYLYFDKDNSVYAKVVSDYTNNNGVLKLSDSDKGDRDYDTYYYYGDITNNNVLYADFCWKMVITTEGNGVKMIYNGVPQTLEDGTISCDNTGDDTTIGKSAFNSSSNSPAYAGYMYNKVYNSNFTYMYHSSRLFNQINSTTGFTGSTYTYSNGTYTLTDPTEYNLSESYSNLGGYYTCLIETETSCSELYYIVGATSSKFYALRLTDGNDYDAYNMKLATSYTENSDGTYTLNSPIEITRKDYYDNYTSYKGYYICDDLTSTTCSEIDYMYYVYNYYFYYCNLSDNYKYGNSFTYDNNTNTYTLIDTEVSSIKQFWNWDTNYKTLSKNHYTCFNTSGTCESLYYIYYTYDSYADYITLTGGKSVEDALNEMLYGDDVNKYDSTIKAKIDSWYESNLLNTQDSEGNLYSSYLQNTIYCNNRAMSNKTSNGWYPDGGSTTTIMSFNYDSLDCENENDQFTLSVDSGGEEGYGNNALKYPIGLLNYEESFLTKKGSTSYLDNNDSYWVLGVSGFNIGNNNCHNYVSNSNVLSSGTCSVYSRVRPAIALSSNVIVTSGDGSFTEPYQVKLN